MKTTRIILLLVFVSGLLFTVGCGDDEATPDPLVAVKGKVTYSNANGVATNAPGAVVYLTNTATTVRISSISNASGDYEFMNVSPGAYTLTASYFSDNKNTAARFDGLNFATADPVSVTVASTDVTQDLALASTGQTGIETLAANYSWNGSAYVQAGSWTYDVTHSPVNFELPYRQNVAADFNGTFSQLSKVVINFDPNNLATANIDVEIDVASFNTRSAGGRDPRTTIDDTPPFNPNTLFKELGCVMGTFGIAADGGTPSDANPLPITTTRRYAQFKSTSVVKMGDGYVAKGNLTFLGVTKATDIWFKVVAPWTDPSNNRRYSGFEGRFMMNAKADFAVNSSSVNDAKVKVQISMVLYKQQ